MAVNHTVAGTVVKERHPLGPIGLSLITLGIYGFVWYYKINKELRDVTGLGSPGVSLLAITLGVLLIVPPFVSLYNTGERIRVMQERAGVAGPINPVLALVIALVPFVGIFWATYLQSALNTGWRRLSGRTQGLTSGGAAGALEPATSPAPGAERQAAEQRQTPPTSYGL